MIRRTLAPPGLAARRTQVHPDKTTTSSAGRLVAKGSPTKTKPGNLLFGRSVEIRYYRDRASMPFEATTLDADAMVMAAKSFSCLEQTLHFVKLLGYRDQVFTAFGLALQEGC